MTDGVLKLRTRGVYAKRVIRNKLIERKEYIARCGDDVPEIPAWNWSRDAASATIHSTGVDNVCTTASQA